MKKIYYLLIFSFVCLTGCATESPIMPAIKYSKHVDFQVKNKAYLYWLEGTHHSAVVYTHANSNNNGIGNGIAALSDYFAMQKEAPKVDVYPPYGKAEQVIFITSLRDILVNNQIFSAVEITTNPKKIAAGVPLININFKSTKQSLDKLTIAFEVNITTDNKSNFNRTYLVESDPKSSSVQLQQVSVSEKLVEKIIIAIKEWQGNKHNNG